MAEASIQGRRRGITVLGLLLVIIALMVAGFFLVRYLRTRQGATDSPPIIRPERGSLSRGSVILSDAKDPSAAGAILGFAQDDRPTSVA
jgi:hypothetical protein